MEMQLLHYKATHSNLTEARKEGQFDSLAMLGIFFSVSQPDLLSFHVLPLFPVDLSSLVSIPSMDDMIDSLVNITQPNTETNVSG